MQVHAVDEAPQVKTHAVKAARVALMHTWLSTQDEGWWRLALDQLQVPYAYISTQDVAKDADLRRKYDVIIFAPVGRAQRAIINGMPMCGNPLPWKTTPLTPNIGKIDSTDDMRPGLGWSGLRTCRSLFSKAALYHRDDTADLRSLTVYTRGVDSRAAAVASSGRHLAIEDGRSRQPDCLWLWRLAGDVLSNGPIFNLSNFAGGRGGRPSSDAARDWARHS